MSGKHKHTKSVIGIAYRSFPPKKLAIIFHLFHKLSHFALTVELLAKMVGIKTKLGRNRKRKNWSWAWTKFG